MTGAGGKGHPEGPRRPEWWCAGKTFECSPTFMVFLASLACCIQSLCSFWSPNVFEYVNDSILCCAYVMKVFQWFALRICMILFDGGSRTTFSSPQADYTAGGTTRSGRSETGQQPPPDFQRWSRAERTAVGVSPIYMDGPVPTAFPSVMFSHVIGWPIQSPSPKPAGYRPTEEVLF